MAVRIHNLADHFAHWQESAKEKEIAKWTTDLCHPNPEGHRVLAELMFPAVQKAIEVRAKK